MAIKDGPGDSPATLAETVWDLAEAFAILARSVAPELARGQAADLLRVTERLHDRALQLERIGLAARLQAAKEGLQD